LNRNRELIGKLGIVHFVESFKRASTFNKSVKITSSNLPMASKHPRPAGRL